MTASLSAVSPDELCFQSVFLFLFPGPTPAITNSVLT